MEEQDLVTVFTLSNSIEAEIIKNALNDEGFHCVIEGENQAAEAGLIGIAIRLQVPSSEARAATAFIQEHEKNKGHEDDEE